MPRNLTRYLSSFRSFCANMIAHVHFTLCALCKTEIIPSPGMVSSYTIHDISVRQRLWHTQLMCDYRVAISPASILFTSAMNRNIERSLPFDDTSQDSELPAAAAIDRYLDQGV